MGEGSTRGFAFERAERELVFRFGGSDAAVGFGAQSYAFDAPRGERDARRIEAMHVAARSPRRMKAIAETRQIDRTLAAMNAPQHVARFRLAYTPHGRPDLLRIALTLRGSRSSVCVVGLAALTDEAREARDKRRPGESILDFLASMAGQNARTLLDKVRISATRLLDESLAAYEPHRLARIAAENQEREAWYRSIAS